MKKCIALLISANLIVAAGVAPISASAESLANPSGIIVFASDTVSSVSYKISKSNYSANVILKNISSGSIYLELQKKDGTTWSYVDSTTDTFSSNAFPSISKNKSLNSGTYRLVIDVTVSGSTTSRTSSEYTI